MPQTVSGFTVPAGTDPVSSIDDTLSTMATEIAAKTINPTLIDAKGDLIAGTAADTPGILTVGANGLVLIADSTQATGLKWGAAGGSTLLSTTAVTGTSAVTVSGIPGTYRDLMVVIANVRATVATATSLTFTMNGANFANTATTGNTVATVAGLPLGTTMTNSSRFTWNILIRNYADANAWKTVSSSGVYQDTTPNTVIHNYFGSTTSGTAITSITITTSGTFQNSGNIYVYGVN